jgi:hypothetical protein
VRYLILRINYGPRTICVVFQIEHVSPEELTAEFIGSLLVLVTIVH